MSDPMYLSHYHIVLLPSLRIAAYGLSLQEAAAWMQTYNSTMQGSGQRAVIDHAAAKQVAA